MSQPALTWTVTGTPVSARFDDPYYSDGAGLAETRHVFLSGNDLPARLCDGFRVAELGFGTGLNLLALLDAWQGPGRLRFTSFEAFPLSAAEMERALAAFDLPQAPALVASWAQATGPVRRLDLPGARVEVRLGDARALLPGWDGRADAWFLDGFAPARNPELWEPELLREVARHTAPGGTFATYTAAGAVRRALEDAGFAVTRRPGFGAKRYMSAGRLEAP
jgi:tRNA U34 5-methylaminomethyl-2-thiouridine-forming methyltransferase MnmC